MESSSNPHRKTIRYAGYDYRSPGAYFVTICATNGKSIFGNVIDEVMVQSPLGDIAYNCWAELPVHFLFVALDSFVIMPNHMHGLLWLHPLPRPEPLESTDVQIDIDAEAGLDSQERTDTIHGVPSAVPTDGCGTLPSRTVTNTNGVEEEATRRFGQPIAGSLSIIVSTYKAAVTRQARRGGLWGNFALWHGRFWDRIVRNEDELNNIRRYIAQNPVLWANDQLHPDAPPNRFNRWTDHS